MVYYGHHSFPVMNLYIYITFHRNLRFIIIIINYLLLAFSFLVRSNTYASTHVEDIHILYFCSYNLYNKPHFHINLTTTYYLQ